MRFLSHSETKRAVQIWSQGEEDPRNRGIARPDGTCLIRSISRPTEKQGQSALELKKQKRKRSNDPAIRGNLLLADSVSLSE